MKEHKIFKPDIVFQKFIRSCWSQNIRTLEDKIPINTFLKERGIFALDIDPDPKQEVYAFGLPVNKSWEASSFSKDSQLFFKVYSETVMSISVIFQNAKSENSETTNIVVDKDNLEVWKEFRIPVLNPEDVRLVLFSGAATTPNYVIRNIVIETDEI